MIGRTLNRAAAVLLMVFAAACSPQESQRRPVGLALPTGEIRGTVKFRGVAPAVRSEVNSKNPEVCGKNVAVTRLQIGANGGVRHVFVYLTGIESSGPAHPVASVTIEQKGCAYAPHSMVVTAGAPIEIVNDDPVLHNVHASAMTENGLQTMFNIAQPVRGQRTKVESALKPGIMTLTCEAGHPWMTAHMLVADHNYVAVTDEDGNFVISGVPGGTYPITMWHEGVALTRIIPSLQQFQYEDPYEITKQVVVTPGSTSEVSFDLELRQ
jgi:plastocyanin